MGTLVSLGPVAAAGQADDMRPLAVMPPASGKRTSHLIVGTYDQPELRVLSLPGLALVHTHRLEGMQVMWPGSRSLWHGPRSV